MRTMFDTIAPRYDLVNRIMTFRMDVGWRRRTVQPPRPGAAARRCSTSPAAPATSAASWPRQGLRADRRRPVVRDAGRRPRTGAPLRAGRRAAPAGARRVGRRRDLRVRAAQPRRARRRSSPSWPASCDPAVASPCSRWPSRPTRSCGWGHGVYFGKVVPRIGGLLSDAAAYRYLPKSVAYLPEPRRAAGHAAPTPGSPTPAATCSRAASPSCSPATRATSRVAVSALDSTGAVARTRARSTDGSTSTRPSPAATACCSSQGASGFAGRGEALRIACRRRSRGGAGGRHDALGRHRRSTTRWACPERGPVAFGALPFDPRRARLADRARGRWSGGPRTARAGSRRSAPPDAPRRARRARPPPPTTPRPRSDPLHRHEPAVARRRGAPPSWPRRDELRAGAARKVVLAREVVVEADRPIRARPCWPAAAALPGLHAVRRSTASSAPAPSCSSPARATWCARTRWPAPRRAARDPTTDARLAADAARVGQGPGRAPRHHRHGPRHAAAVVLVPRRGGRAVDRGHGQRAAPGHARSRAGCRARRRRCSSWCRRCTRRPAVGGSPRAAALALIDRARGHRPRSLRRPGGLGRRRRQRRVGRRHPLRGARRRRRPACSPASASSPTPTPTPSWPRPGPSSRRCSAPSSAPDHATLRKREPACSVPVDSMRRSEGGGHGGVDLGVDGHVGGPVGAGRRARGRRRARPTRPRAGADLGLAVEAPTADAVGRGQRRQVDAVRRAEELLEAARRRARRPGAGTRRCRHRRCRRRRS